MASLLVKIEGRVESGELAAACWKGDWRTNFEKWVEFIDQPILHFFLANPSIIVLYISRMIATIPSSRILEEVNAVLAVPDSIWEVEAGSKPCGHLMFFAVNWGYGMDGHLQKLAANLFHSCFV